MLEVGYILLSWEWLVHSSLPSTGGRIKEALLCSEWQLMVHVAVEMREGGLRGDTQQVCMCVASSCWTHESLCFKMVYIYSHMHVCACIWILAAVLYGLTNMHLWANSRGNFLLLRHRPLLPRPLKPLRGGRVAEGTNSLLPICSFSQQLKSPRSAAISSNLSQCNFGGTREKASQRLTVAICTCTAGGVNCTVTPCSCRLIDPWVIPAVSQLGGNRSRFYKDGRTCAELRVRTTNKKSTDGSNSEEIKLGTC